MMDPIVKEKKLLKDIRKLEKNIKDNKQGLLTLEVKLEKAKEKLRSIRGRV